MMKNMKLLLVNVDYRAMTKLKWTEVPAIIRNLSDKETASIALIENFNVKS